MMSKRNSFLCAALALALAILAPVQAQATLLIAPTRVVFEGRSRSATVLLLNTDKKVHTYRLGWVLKKADENGQYTNLPTDEKDPFYVGKMVVFSPRQVTINPDARQTIRLSLRRPANLPPGEYRAHLVIETLPGTEERRSLGGDPKKGVALALNVSFGMTIPVFVRSGDLETPVIAIKNPVVLPPTKNDPRQRQRLQVDLARVSGVTSPYGPIRVFAQQGGEEKEIGQIRTVAVYKEQEKRVIAIPVTAPLTPGTTVRVLYEGGEEYGGKVFAEQKITL